MLNIIRAQSRQFLKDRFTWYTLFVGFVFPILIIILNSDSASDALSGSASVPKSAEISTFIPLIMRSCLGTQGRKYTWEELL